MFSRKLTRLAAAGAAIVAIAIGGFAIGNASSDSSGSGTANAAPLAQPGQTPRLGPRSGHPSVGSQPSQAQTVGQIPKDWRPGTGTIITGPAADKATAAARTKYPAGTVNRVLKLSDGSYAVHIIGTSGPHHVFVSKDFKVTGAA